MLPESLVTKVTPEEMDEFLDLCGTRENFAGKQKSAFDYIGDIFKSLFIFPGNECVSTLEPSLKKKKSEHEQFPVQTNLDCAQF